MRKIHANFLDPRDATPLGGPGIHSGLYCVRDGPAGPPFLGRSMGGAVDR